MLYYCLVEAFWVSVFEAHVIFHHVNSYIEITVVISDRWEKTLSLTVTLKVQECSICVCSFREPE